MSTSYHGATDRSPAGFEEAHRRFLVELSRHTSRDTIVIATALTARKAIQDRSALNLATSDVDGLSMVIQHLDGPHLNLVLHGAGGHLEAAAQVVTLLRGRFEVIRAMVPSCALAGMALIACACDVIMMPPTAVLGADDDEFHHPVSADVARDWVSRHCAHPDRAVRAEAVGSAFATTDSPRTPLAASRARESGFPVKIIPERSDIGRNLEDIWQGVDAMMREKSLLRIIDCQKGPVYTVEG
jgi:hypothetical protein